MNEMVCSQKINEIVNSLRVYFGIENKAEWKTSEMPGMRRAPVLKLFGCNSNYMYVSLSNDRNHWEYHFEWISGVVKYLTVFYLLVYMDQCSHKTFGEREERENIISNRVFYLKEWRRILNQQFSLISFRYFLCCRMANRCERIWNPIAAVCFNGWKRADRRN